MVRLIIKVGIAYGSDVQRAKRILLETARNSNYVLPDPQPRALFCSFGESALEFELRVFVRDIDEWIHACDSLHCEIDEAFRRAGIEIAFPQRDIHVRSIRAALPVDDGRRSAPGDPTAAADRAET